VFRQPKDVKCCITFLRYIHRQWNDVPSGIYFRHLVTEILICSLAIQVELGLGEDQEIKEMAELCNECFSSDVMTTLPTDAIKAFVSAVCAHLDPTSERPPPSEDVIDCLQKATLRKPDLHIVPIALACSLLIRFHRTPLDDDYKERMVVVDKIICFCGPRSRPSLYLGEALDLAVKFDINQFTVDGKPEHCPLPARPDPL